MLIVTKRFTFEYAHYLPYYDGLCRNMHGHSGKLEVSIEGVPEEEGSNQGMVMDFKELKEIVNKQVIRRLDHVLLNELLVTPTCENLLLFIRDQLINYLPLYRLRLWETEDSYAEWVKDET